MVANNLGGKMKRILNFIKKHGICKEGYKYSLQFDDPQKWWNCFERGDWMLWVIGKAAGSPMSKSRKKLVLCACKCARTALPYIQKGEIRPIRAIEVAEQWARGDIGVTLDDVYSAAYAASDASDAAAYAADAAAAYAADAAADAAYAAYAADAADAAAYAASYAADAAAGAAYAAAGAAYAAAGAAYAADAVKKTTLKQCADIVREHYTVDDFLTLIL
jgi:hypothetical protein